MPYTPEHKQRSRERLLVSAYELFAHHGYECITIDQVTQHAGLTRGAFYNHFSSKQALYQEAMRHAAATSKMSHLLECELSETDTIRAMIEGYLSPAHLADDQPCPLAFLVTDVANKEPQVRDTYTQIFKGLTHKIGGLLNDSPKQRDKSRALAALLIGGAAVGRAINDQQLTSQLLEACRSAAFELVGNGED